MIEKGTFDWEDKLNSKENLFLYLALFSVTKDAYYNARSIHSTSRLDVKNALRNIDYSSTNVCERTRLSQEINELQCGTVIGPHLCNNSLIFQSSLSGNYNEVQFTQPQSVGPCKRTDQGQHIKQCADVANFLLSLQTCFLWRFLECVFMAEAVAGKPYIIK